MKTKKNKGVLFLGVMLCSATIFSQQKSNELLGNISNQEIFQISNSEISFKKKSLGLEFGRESGSIQLGITYRRFFENSKWNFRANYNQGGRSDFYYNFRGREKLLFNTGDSLTPVIGVDKELTNGGYTNYQRLDLGVEKQFSIWKLNLIAGIDGSVGHKVSNDYRAVSSMQVLETWQNGIKYYEYIPVGEGSTDLVGELNALSTKINSITFGAVFRLGCKLDINERFYATAFAGYRVEGYSVIKEQNDYKNELYKEHLPTSRDINFITADSFAKVGIHYRL